MKFTTNWFQPNQAAFSSIFERFSPKLVLELGAFEGQATCWMADRMPDGKIEVVDTWAVEYAKGAEELFDSNIAELTSPCLVVKHKVDTSTFLRNVAPSTYDLVYIDADHRAFSVLSDAVLAFDALKVGGILIFDDYHFTGVTPPPKLAIDAFTTCYAPKVRALRGYSNRQVYLVKESV